jgi:hypothetical protein
MSEKRSPNSAESVSGKKYPNASQDAVFPGAQDLPDVASATASLLDAERVTSAAWRQHAEQLRLEVERLREALTAIRDEHADIAPLVAFVDRTLAES